MHKDSDTAKRSHVVLLSAVIVVAVAAAAVLYWQASTAPTVQPVDIPTVNTSPDSSGSEAESDTTVDPAALQAFGFWIPGMDSIVPLAPGSSYNIGYAFGEDETNAVFIYETEEDATAAVEAVGDTETEEFTSENGVPGTETRGTSEKDGSTMRFVTVPQGNEFLVFAGDSNFLDDVRQYIAMQGIEPTSAEETE